MRALSALWRRRKTDARRPPTMVPDVARTPDVDTKRDTRQKCRDDYLVILESPRKMVSSLRAFRALPFYAEIEK